MSEIPDDLIIADFHDNRNRLSYYLPKLQGIEGVRTPATAFFDIGAGTTDPSVLTGFDEMDVAIWMRTQGYDQAFVRSDFSSAKARPRKGSFIYAPEGDVVLDTVATLIASHIQTDRETGGTLAVREWLDLDYCPQHNPNHWHPTEVRYFIGDGEIKYRHPEPEKFEQQNLDCNTTYSYVKEDMREGVEYPDAAAKAAAETFDGHWSLDFVRHAKTGEWYATDMGLDGLYWHDELEEWCAISEHTNDEYDPEVQYADELSPDMARE